MRRRLLGATVALAALIAGAGWTVTGPRPLDPEVVADLSGDADRGKLAFAAAGCGSCHIAPKSEPADPPVLSGGRSFVSPFGTFIAPNISNGPKGLSDWSDVEIASAILTGVSRNGAHLFPAFPYTTYARAEPQDVMDLVAYLRTLPASDVASLPHDVGFPFNIRRSLGGWKLLFLNNNWVVTDDLTPEETRGRYLVEALGHCGECHTPRNLLGGLQRGLWLGGAANPSGEGRIPNITPGALTWSTQEIVEYLTSGFTPEFDTAGGEMVAVIRNTSQLPAEDRAAIAAYLKRVPPIQKSGQK